MALLKAVQHVSYGYEQGHFQTAVAQVSAWHRLAVLIAAGLLATFMVWLLRKLSHGANSDIVHAIWFQSGRVNFWHTIVQAMLSMTIVGMGASLGREGAPKQVGLAIASVLSRWGRLTSAETRFLAACGAGAGMGAIYNVPLGGALFALEVLLGTVALPLILPAMTAALIATAVSWITLPNQPTYTIPFIRSILESCSGPFSSDHWLGSCPFYLCGSLFGLMPINHSPDGPCGPPYPCLPCLAFSPFPIHSFWGTVWISLSLPLAINSRCS
ncbi:membrane protein of unknown function [Acidithiobacillus ferrivorans]|nr:membrane protein of unknown function [Acidithiobacillus ferrivorans]